MSQQMVVVPKRQRVSFRERVSRAIEAVRSYTLTGLLSSDRKTAEIFGFGAKTDAGIVVTARNAYTFSAVFDAVNQGSSDIAKLPLNLLKRRKEGGSDHHTESRTYRLLKDEPNPEMSAMDMRQTLQAHAMTLKGCFAEIERDGAGRPFWLWPITPDRVEEKRERGPSGKEDGPIYYLIDGQDRIPARDMLHIKGLGYDGLIGYSTIDKARQAIGLALAAEKFGASFFGDGAGFPGLLGIKSAVGPESMEKLRQHVDTQYGRGSWNRFLILDNDPQFTPFGVEPQKAQMNELRSKQVEEVARFFNFPVHKLKNLDRATNNNIEQQDLEYYKGFILNWTTKWEQECNRKLIPPLERSQQFVKHNVNAFLRGDTAARTALYSAMVDRGIFNADMVLEFEDMNPQPNGLGQVYVMNSTFVPKDQLEALAKARTTPPAAPPPADPDDDDDDDVTQEDVDQANDRAVKAERLAEELRTAAAAAEQRAAELAGAATASETLVTEARATAAAEAARATAAELLAAEVRRTAETVQQQFTDVEAERARLAVEIESERTGRAADVERLEQAQRDEAARAGAAAAAAAVQRAEAERLALDIETHRQTMGAVTTERDTARGEAERLLTELATAQEAVTAAETRASEAQGRVEEASGRLAELERALEAERSARRGQVSAEIAAHRALVVDTTRRMIERETERARRNQATSEKLRAWLETFYSGHADLMRTALLPAVRIHVAWMGSTDDANDVTRRLVERHIEESQRQIRVVLDGDADEMAGSLPALLHRWETERVDVIADALMQKELDHVRER